MSSNKATKASKADKNSIERDTDAYTIYNFVSPCCNAFNYYDEKEIHCSNCKKTIANIQDGETLTIMTKDNTNPNLNSISEDIVNDFNAKAPRYANDNGCEKINKTCPKCKNNEARYLRNPKGIIIYVCTKCRYVYNDLN